MSWVALALGTALCETGRDLCLRRLLRRSGWSVARGVGLASGVAALLLLPAALLTPGSVRWPAFLGALLAGGGLNVLAFWNYGRALALEELSLVLPLVNLSPVVLLVSGWLVLGERPGALAAAGLLLLVVGAFGLGASAGGRRCWLPRAGTLLARSGCRAMLLVALLWGVAASIDKLGVRASDGLRWVMALQLMIGGALLTAAGRPRAGGADPIPADGPSLLPLLVLVAALGAGGTLLQMEAIQRTAVVHVIALKRLSTLFGSGVGVLALGEGGGMRRLAAAALMLLGAVAVIGGAGSP